ncbi:MAG TPA: MmgE/PrpD family protein [Gammaproteobacteria bacterium]|nr:MmgE/PrpD family protein [Gammaproteobacteria bacterium]|tara:strand:+ start:331 stop:1782 length:1452 start_codon:yes stop_codon:yes gene_type:complete
MSEPSTHDLSASTADAAGQFAEFVSNFDLNSVPKAVTAHAKLCILDAVGIGLASCNYPFAKTTAAALDELGGVGAFPVIGFDLHLPQRDAAHLIGTLIHGLDFDDTHSEAVVHTSASMVPTMLTAGLANDCDGPAALSAFIIGSECASRIGAAARGGFHEKGFHPTGVVGAFGSALSAGYLYGLNRNQLKDAQGIVLSKAAGSMQFLDDGAWTKRNHPGWASVCAQTAVVMAKHGFFGPREPYFGRFGLFSAHTQEGSAINVGKLTDRLGEQWEMLNIAFKPYPACHMTHAFADATIQLKRKHLLVGEDVNSIVAYVHPNEIPVICEPARHKLRPQNSYDAQFSINYVIAAAFLREEFGLAELEDKVLDDPDILNFCAKVSYEPDPQSAYPEYFSGAIDIHTKDGRLLHHREQMNRGSVGNPMSGSDIKAKYLDNANRTISTKDAKRLMQLVLNLEHEHGLKTLTDALRKTDKNLETKHVNVR